MLTLDMIRRYATALPEVEENPHFGRPGFRVRDQLFTSVHLDEEIPFAIVHIDSAVAGDVATNEPDIFREVWRTHGQKRIFVGLKVDLSKVTPDRCHDLIHMAWRFRAPKRLVAAHDNQ